MDDRSGQIVSLMARRDAARGAATALATRPGTREKTPDRLPLGPILLQRGAVDPGNLLKAAAMRTRGEARLGEILLAHGWVQEADLLDALASQHKSSAVDLERDRPDPRLIDAIGAELCLKEAIAPWRRIGGTTVIAVARPEEFTRIAALLPQEEGPYRMVVASERAVHEAVVERRRTAMIRRAEARVAAEESCRNSDPAVASNIALGAILAVTLGMLTMPLATFTVIFAWAVLTLYATMGLKLFAWIAQVRAVARSARTEAEPVPIRLPTISVLVPLFNERDIAARLVQRLGRLNYPRELLDILLVVEETDDTTLEALAGASLPRWMRVVTVPRGPIQTKPRAMNYALGFCRGSIIGIYDAEDRPDPEQLNVVARRFAVAPPEVVCLQGILDYYNPRTNWLARCFTIEYAAWFRAMLPGLARLGFVVPLGGTTLFFRRDKLEELGGWDAHNVTEDADLGLRLARHGYKTELIDTVTQEEANCRALPWVKQRSRWLKGYAMTWAVHMRDPRRLWRELGPRGFIGVQILFLGSLSQYLLSPMLWTCWLMAFGLPHPVSAVMPTPMVIALIGSFVLSEAVNIMVGIWATRGSQHRHLIPWVPTLHFYFPLGALAGWRAIYEAVTRPFHWEKTAHGIFDHVAEAEPVTGPGSEGAPV